jgi:hypothetical protein
MIGLESIELDRIPANESSLTNRRDWRPILAQLEARLFRRQIIQQFGRDELEANSVSVRVKIHYGNYTEPEVIVSYDPNFDSSVRLAFRIESNCWNNWSRESNRILRFANNLTDEQLENARLLDDTIILELLGDWE